MTLKLTNATLPLLFLLIMEKVHKKIKNDFLCHLSKPFKSETFCHPLQSSSISLQNMSAETLLPQLYSVTAVYRNLYIEIKGLQTMIMGHMVNIATKHIILRVSKFEKHLLILFKDSSPQPPS